MEKYKYIVIDDEFSSHLTVKHYFKNYPNYLCVNSFYNPEHALKFLESNDVDLIFLDIEMPKMSGFQFLDALKKRTCIIFLTGYSDKYSLKAHEYGYDNDLLIFTNKAQFSYFLPKVLSSFEKKHSEKMILDRFKQYSKNEINTFPKMISNRPIQLIDIIIITVIGHYLVLEMKGGEEIIYRMTMCELTDLLPPNTFLQISRNVVINLMQITAFTNTTICLNGKHFHISTRRRKKIVPILLEQRRELYNCCCS